MSSATASTSPTGARGSLKGLNSTRQKRQPIGKSRSNSFSGADSSDHETPISVFSYLLAIIVVVFFVVVLPDMLDYHSVVLSYLHVTPMMYIILLIMFVVVILLIHFWIRKAIAPIRTSRAPSTLLPNALRPKRISERSHSSVNDESGTLDSSVVEDSASFIEDMLQERLLRTGGSGPLELLPSSGADSPTPRDIPASASLISEEESISRHESETVADLRRFVEGTGHESGRSRSSRAGGDGRYSRSSGDIHRPISVEGMFKLSSRFCRFQSIQQFEKLYGDMKMPFLKEGQELFSIRSSDNGSAYFVVHGSLGLFDAVGRLISERNVGDVIDPAILILKNKPSSGGETDDEIDDLAASQYDGTFRQHRVYSCKALCATRVVEINVSRWVKFCSQFNRSSTLSLVSFIRTTFGRQFRIAHYVLTKVIQDYQVQQIAKTSSFFSHDAIKLSDEQLNSVCDWANIQQQSDDLLESNAENPYNFLVLQPGEVLLDAARRKLKSHTPDSTVFLIVQGNLFAVPYSDNRARKSRGKTHDHQLNFADVGGSPIDLLSMSRTNSSKTGDDSSWTGGGSDRMPVLGTTAPMDDLALPNPAVDGDGLAGRASPSYPFSENGVPSNYPSPGRIASASRNSSEDSNSDDYQSFTPGSVIGVRTSFSGSRYICSFHAHERVILLPISLQTEDSDERLLRLLSVIAWRSGRLMSRYTDVMESIGLRSSLHRAGRVLYRQGQPSKRMFIIVSGKVQLFDGPPPDRNRGDNQDILAASDELRDESGEPGSSFGPYCSFFRYRSSSDDDPAVSYSSTTGAEIQKLVVGRGRSVGQVTFLRSVTSLTNLSDASSELRPHSMSAVVFRDSEVVELNIGAFCNVWKRCPHFFASLVEETASFLLASSNPKFSPNLKSSDTSNSGVNMSPSPKSHHHQNRITAYDNVSTIAVVAVHPSIDIHRICRRIYKSSAMYGSSTLLTRTSIESALRQGVISSAEFFDRSRLSHLLALVEDKFDRVFFECRFIPPGSEHDQRRDDELWNQLALRSADLVLVVADASESPQITSMESRYFFGSWKNRCSSTAPKELVLVQPKDAALPIGTYDWLSRRSNWIRSHHHLPHPSCSVEERRWLYQRLARVVSGNGVGLVLSGGGSRGLAHVGALNAFEQYLLHPDFLGGTSQGSFVAALYGKHASFKLMQPECRAWAAEMGNLLSLLMDSTLPVMAYFSGKFFGKGISDVLGETTNICDLWIPYFCVTTNLTKVDMSVHTQGVLWKAVRASMSVLEYLPPMFLDNCLLIDGGYLSNLPVDVMNEVFGPGTIAAVDVENKDADDLFVGVRDYGDSLSGFWLLCIKMWNWINPWSEPARIPRYSDIVASLNYIHHAQMMKNLPRLADVYVRPDVSNIKLLDYHLYDELLVTGHRRARLAMLSYCLQHNVPNVVPGHPALAVLTSMDNETANARSHNKSAQSPPSSVMRKRRNSFSLQQ